MFSDPVIGERFFGRTQILSTLGKRVDGLKDGYRQNIAIIGRELLGKSSILRHFLSSFRSQQVIPIYADIETDSFNHFVNRFIGVLLYHFLKQEGREVSGDLKFLIKQSRESIPDTVKAIEKLPDLVEEKKFDQAYSLLFDLSLILKEETGKKVIVVLDEFQRLSGFNIKNPFTKLGKKIMVQKDTMYIVASSEPERAKKILSKDLALLFGNFELIELKPFDFAAATSFLDQRLEEINPSPEHKRFLTAFTNGHPFYLDALSLSLLKLRRASKEKPDALALMVGAIESSLFDSQGILNQYFTFFLNQRFKDKDFQALVSLLLAVACGNQKLKNAAKSMGLKVRDISRRIEELAELDLISRNGTFHKFNDRMFEFWLKSSYRRKQGSLTPDLSYERKEFQGEVKEMIACFSSELKKSISQRVCELFKCFENEIVEINQRRRRLPQFTNITNHGPYLRASKLPPLSEDRGKGKAGMWICTIKENQATETEVREFLKVIKESKPRKILQKILIAPNGMEDNARLLTKEKKIWAWDLKDLNFLLDLYGKPRIV